MLVPKNSLPIPIVDLKRIPRAEPTPFNAIFPSALSLLVAFSTASVFSLTAFVFSFVSLVAVIVDLSSSCLRLLTLLVVAVESTPADFAIFSIAASKSFRVASDATPVLPTFVISTCSATFKILRFSIYK